MELIKLENDINVILVSAKSFPAGVKDAFDTLGSTLTEMENRRMYGISHGNEKGGITYYAATTELEPGEAEKYGFEHFTIRKGEYAAEIVQDFMENFGMVGNVFRELLSNPALDPKGYCLEWYLSEREVRCMVKLKIDNTMT